MGERTRRMYGDDASGSDAEAQASDVAPPDDRSGRAERMYETADKTPGASTGDPVDREQRMYGESSDEANFGDIGFDGLFDAAEVDHGERERVQVAVVDTFRGLELGRNEATEAMALMNQAAREPASDAEIMRWETQSNKMLHDRYGADAESKLALAQKMVARDPKLAAYLDRTGLGNNPQVIQKMIERAQSMLSAGKL